MLFYCLSVFGSNSQPDMAGYGLHGWRSAHGKGGISVSPLPEALEPQPKYLQRCNTVADHCPSFNVELHNAWIFTSIFMVQ
jgi:hypothetical protein